MRICILALTETGARLAQRIQRASDNATVLLPEKGKNWATAASGYFPRLSAVVPQAFAAYDALVFVMATGIVVRTIAPLLKGKLSDPAVLVFDEQGTHGISLLSGHVGRANDLTRALCKALGSEPVITTATDVEGLVAPDAIASALGLYPTPKSAIQGVNSLLLEKKEVPYYMQKDMIHGEFYQKALKKYSILLQPLRNSGAEPIAVVLTDHDGAAGPGYLYLLPRRLIAGIGCRKNTTRSEIEAALQRACGLAGLSTERIDAYASTAVKREEVGLLAFSTAHKCEISFFENEVMQRCIDQYHLEESSFVKKTIGIGNVCEAAALCATAGQGGRFALVKTKFEKVTVALLWQNVEQSR